MTFLALGDSYTIGEGVAIASSWPNQLVGALTVEGVIMAEPLIIARTGWTTSDLMAGIEQIDPQGPFGLVSLLIGVNNQYRGTQQGYTPDNYRSDFIVILNQAIELAGGNSIKVVVLSIPDYSATPFVAEENKIRVSEEIYTYNQINREESTRAGTRYIDITPISRMAANNPSLLAADGLHPSGEMYRLWVQLIVETLMSPEEQEQ